jgi:MarR family 2-MHQ and catechol resistance regulon transcriptional repressor
MKNIQKYGKSADLALNLWVKLSRASATFSKLSAANIKSFGLTVPQFSVLECLGHLGPLTLGILSKKMLVCSGNTTVVVDNLEKESLVERLPSKEDRRAILVRLTPKGKKLFEEIFIKHAGHIVKAVSVLSENEQILLSQLLKKFGLALQEQNQI